MYFTDVRRCWCIELQCECWMKLTYHRVSVAERGLVRDFLVSAEPVASPEVASEPAHESEACELAPAYH